MQTLAVAGTACLCMLLCVGALQAPEGQPLFDYINNGDNTYSYFDTGHRWNVPADKERGYPGWTGYLLNLTSQTWLTEAESNHPVWTHQLAVVVPNGVIYTDKAAIWVTGGNNGDGAPSNTSEDMLVVSVLAMATKSIVAGLFQVPNQPIVFPSDPEHKSRIEDEIIAYTWRQFMDNLTNPDVILELPMTKSVVKAMDAVTDFTSKLATNGSLPKATDIQKYMVYGASKRGWTTWLTGAADKRVIGIAPIVMDMLNLAKNLPHMYQAYGGWTFAFTNYWNQNVTNMLGTPQFTALANIVDPLAYRAQLTMPKLVIDSTGDEFFMPDDDHYWWGMLQGETKRLMVANAEHSFITGIIPLLDGLDAFYQSLLDEAVRPELTWAISPSDGSITLKTSTRPIKATMFFAHTSDAVRRDFRLIKGDTPADPCHFIPVKVFGHACLNPVFWASEELQPYSIINGTYTYEAFQAQPPSGWAGFFLEVQYPGPAQSVYRFTSQVSIVPNTFPFQSCESIGNCHGQLV